MIAIILSGGSGTRFWPISTEDNPKQFIKLLSDKPLVYQTFDRLNCVADSSKILISCSRKLLKRTQEIFNDLSCDQFIVEPIAKNTAAAIGLASIYSKYKFGDEVIGIFPSDHYIHNLEAFRETVAIAISAANKGSISTIGIPPSYPETGYGYIKYNNFNRGSKNNKDYFSVISFKEKPNKEQALSYIFEGNYLWNSGMFFFKPSVFLSELKRQQPSMYRLLDLISKSLSEDKPKDYIEKLSYEVFNDIESISVDYAIMENARNVTVVPATFAWSDVGQWAALNAVLPNDDNDNVIRLIRDSKEQKDDNTILYNVKNSVIYRSYKKENSKSKKILAAAHLKDIVIVDTDDALLVIPKEHTQDVKKLVEMIDGS